MAVAPQAILISSLVFQCRKPGPVRLRSVAKPQSRGVQLLIMESGVGLAAADLCFAPRHNTQAKTLVKLGGPQLKCSLAGFPTQ